MERKGLAMETCVYIRRRADRLTRVLLWRPVDGFNASKWVPLGSKIALTSSPFDTAMTDLSSVGLSERPQMCGLVTEICTQGGWQNLLFIYVGSAPASWEPGFREGMELRWFPLDSLAELDLPQADHHFDLQRMFDEHNPVLQGRVDFDGQGVLL